MSAAFNVAESDIERPPWIQLLGIEIVGVTVTAQAWAENAVVRFRPFVSICTTYGEGAMKRS